MMYVTASEWPRTHCASRTGPMSNHTSLRTHGQLLVRENPPSAGTASKEDSPRLDFANGVSVVFSKCKEPWCICSSALGQHRDPSGLQSRGERKYCAKPEARAVKKYQ